MDIVPTSDETRADSCSVCYKEAEKQYNGTKYCQRHYEERIAREKLW